MEEREPNEETSAKTQHQLGDDIHGHTPVLLEDPLHDDGELLRYRHGEFFVLAVVDCFRILRCRVVLLLFVDAVDLGLDFRRFVASVPEIEPAVARWVDARVDNLDHVFSRVLVVLARSRAVAFKVVEEGSRVVANRSEIYRFTTAGEEEKLVKFLEKDCTGLVNRAQNGLTGVGKFSQEVTDSPGALGVETTMQTLVKFGRM